MKIITKDAAYIQKRDIVYLNQIEEMPASIFKSIFNDGIAVVDDSNMYEFVKFEEKYQIDFLKQIDYVIDYNLVKNYDKEELIEFGQSIAQQRNELVKKYNAMTKEEQVKNEYIINECEKLQFKMNMVVEIIDFKKGNLNFELPVPISYGDEYKIVEETGIQKILMKIRNNLTN